MSLTQFPNENEIILKGKNILVSASKGNSKVLSNKFDSNNAISRGF